MKQEPTSRSANLLELYIKVAKNWRKAPSFIRRAMKPPEKYLPE